MPKRLTFFLIALVGLLSNLIPVSITTRDAYAIKIGFIETTDFWLDLPLGKNPKNEYIPDDLKVTDWLLTNLDEIDVKEVLSPHGIFISEIDSFDPPPVDVEKFPSNLLVFPSILMIMVFFTCSGFVFFDKITFKTVRNNCFRPDKSISWRRIKKEIGRFSQFVLKILFIIVCYIVLSATCYIAFSDTLLALSHQEFLWNNQYGLIVLLLSFGVTFYFFVFKLSLVIFKGYKNKVIQRSYFYYSIDID